MKGLGRRLREGLRLSRGGDSARDSMSRVAWRRLRRSALVGLGAVAPHGLGVWVNRGQDWLVCLVYG